MAVRRQRLQIIVCVIVVEDGDLDFEILFMRMRLGQRFGEVDAPRLSESGLCSVAPSAAMKTHLSVVNAFLPIGRTAIYPSSNGLARCNLHATGVESMHRIHRLLKQARSTLDYDTQSSAGDILDQSNNLYRHGIIYTQTWDTRL
jgi:hypothetical protein